MKALTHAEEAGTLIIHLTEDNKPVLIEIQDASEFLANLTRISIGSQGEAAAKRGFDDRSEDSIEISNDFQRSARKAS